MTDPSPQDALAALEDLPLDEVCVRRVRWVDMQLDLVTGDRHLNPISALQFDPDLSLTRDFIVTEQGSSLSAEYPPPLGIILVPLGPLDDYGAPLKKTPRSDNGIKGLAHASVYGKVRPKPSQTERREMRDLIEENFIWHTWPMSDEPADLTDDDVDNPEVVVPDVRP